MGDALQAMVRIHGEIPDPTFGYLTGNLIEHRRIDYVLMGDLVERDLAKLDYVGKLGRNDIDVPFFAREEMSRL